MLVGQDVFDDINVDKWPLVYVNLRRPPANDAEIDRFQARFCSMLSLAVTGSQRVPKGSLFLLMNLDGIVESTLQQQMRAANFISTVRDLARNGIFATALIVKNETARTILDIIIKLQPLQSKHEVFDTKEDAESWLHGLVV
jgi:hypothetical protein